MLIFFMNNCENNTVEAKKDHKKQVNYYGEYGIM